MELEIAGVGSSATPTSVVRWLDIARVARAGAPATRALSAVAGDGLEQVTAAAKPTLGLDIQLLATSFHDVGTRTNGGVRHVSATYQVRNAQACTTPGACPAYATTRQNLSFVAAVTPASLAQSAVRKLLRSDGGAADPALAQRLLPTHGMAANGTTVDASRASLQVYRDDELAAPDAGVSGLLPYGFVVSHASNGSRALAANPATNQFDGRVTFSFKIPLQADAKDDPAKFVLTFQVVEDADKRLTQSLEEADFAGDKAAQARAGAIGIQTVTVMGSRVAQLVDGDPICDVRVSGTLASPGGFLAHNGNSAGAGVKSAPHNLSNMPLDSSVRLGACAPMNPPVGGSLTVYGSMSGLRTLSRSDDGQLDGGMGSAKPNQLAWKLRAGDRPFVRGETVSFVATGRATGTDGQALPAFVGSFATVGSVSGSQGRFQTRRYPLSGAITAMAVGDVDGDGQRDLVVSNTTSGTVALLLGDGAGGFSSTRDVAVGMTPNGVALADLNGDDKLDLVVANEGAAELRVMSGDGRGGFGTPMKLTTGASPRGVAIGDVNGDGKLDILVANGGSNVVSIHLGDGRGGFAVATFAAAGGSPDTLVLGDVNGDGRPDIVVSNGGLDGHVSVLPGLGGGRFSSPTRVASGSSESPIALGDLNGDGKLDLVVANHLYGYVVALLGNGAGSFAPTRTMYLAQVPRSLSLGDVDGDGKLDIVVAHELESSAAVALGDGAGNFATARRFPIQSGATSMTLADMTGDGRLDIVAAGGGASGAVVVLPGQPGADPFQSPDRWALAGAGRVVLGDVNADGLLDIVTVVPGSHSIVVMPGLGAGQFGPPIQSNAAGLTNLGDPYLGDLNGDGRLDLVIPNTGGQNTVSVFSGDGSGRFAYVGRFNIGTTYNFEEVLLGDLNGDGKLDIVTLNSLTGTVSVLPGLGDGTLGAPKVITVAGSHTMSAGRLVDLDGDGKLDLVIAASGTVAVWRGDGAGGMVAGNRISFPAGSSVLALAVADLNGDGQPDVVATLSEPGSAQAGTSRAAVLLGDGRGGLSDAGRIDPGSSTGMPTLADLNGDGHQDLLCATRDGLVVMLGDGAGGFGSASTFVGGGRATVADVNGDGRLDVLTYSSEAAAIFVWPGR